uniref:Uncharacterized protein n=1 Tax=Sus scrofa TaxID=9823 RepID=A0A8D1CV92_PIG
MGEGLSFWNNCAVSQASEPMLQTLQILSLLKVLETFTACVIFAFISNISLYQEQLALGWFLMLNLGDCEYRLPILFPIFQLGLTLFSVRLYDSALVLWPLYQFDEKVGGQPQRSSDVTCSTIGDVNYSVCPWDQRLAVTILTAINLLLYVADLVFWSCRVSVGTEDPPGDS